MSIGIWQIVLIVLVVLIVFGAGKLPKVMGDMGKGMRNFKEGLNSEDADTGKSDKDQPEDKKIDHTTKQD